MAKLVLDKPHPDVQFKEVWNNSVKENAIVCDVYFEPQYVWEIKAADLSLSPMHSAALGEVDSSNCDKGVALRFNRHIRDRPDKQACEATTSDQIIEMYHAQASVATANACKFNEDDDDFDL